VSARPAPERPGDHVPGAAEFAGWPPLGALSGRLAAGPVDLRLSRLDRDALDSLERWAGAPSALGCAAAPLGLDLELTRSERSSYLDLDASSGEPLRLLTWAEPGGGHAMVTHHGALLVDETAERGIGVLARQTPEQLDLSLQNLLRVAVAWRLARSGAGLLVHAATVVDEGRAILLLGHSGAGKTTAARAAGPRDVLADDVTLLERPSDEAGAWLAHPSPFWAEPGFPGRRSAGGPVPVALACSLRHARRAAFEPLPRSRAAVVVASCSPFLGGAPGAFDAAGAAAAFARSVPAGVLSFSRDADFWPCLGAACHRTDHGEPCP
jgi:hypothetical protein